MAISVRSNMSLLSRIKALAKLQRFNHTLMDGGLQAQFHREMGSVSVVEQGHVDISNWKKLDSRMYGITRSMISSPSWIVLKVLHGEGFEAYLVGGCVRDLLLNKIPKDFDVITTANLKQIRQKFYRAEIVGRRFPICMVHVKGSVIEVSSFETVAKHAKEKEKHLVPRIPKGCDLRDIIRWRNSMHRDFTVNSLFFDPFVNKIYDYANGMMDLKSLKLRTLLPAELSFEEDCARILRGLRIAARLSLSISKETVTAIHKLSSSITNLSSSRIMMELNYMLSYGAAEPSLCLLRRFNLLKILLPFHAAYLDQQASNHASERSMMLMRLFSNLDKLVTCDRPSSCSLWIGLLAFHLALVNKPQDPLVVWTFSSILYHGNWKDGVKYAREHVQEQVNCLPEISNPCDCKSDRELVEKVAQLASVVQASIDPLIEKESLYKSMSRFPLFPCSGLVFVPRKTGKDVAQLFNVLVDDIESYKHGRKSFKIDYDLLGKGDPREIRYALGKVILDTMSGGVFHVKETNQLHAFEYKQKPRATLENHLTLSDVIKQQVVVNEDKKRRHSRSNNEFPVKREKRQRLVEKSTSQHVKTENKQRVIKDTKCLVVAELLELVENKKGQETRIHQQELKEGNFHMSQDEVIKEKKVVDLCKLSQVERTMTGENMLNKNIHARPQERGEKQNVVKKKKSHDTVNKHSKMEEEMKQNISQDEIIKMHPKASENRLVLEDEITMKPRKVLEKCSLAHDKIIQLEEAFVGNDSHLPQEEVSEKNEEHEHLVKEKRNRQLLSSLFK